MREEQSKFLICQMKIPLNSLQHSAVIIYEQKLNQTYQNKKEKALGKIYIYIQG